MLVQSCYALLDSKQTGTLSKESCSIAIVIGFKNGMQHSKLETLPSGGSILKPFRVSKELAAA
jgi:hypothetical protein